MSFLTLPDSALRPGRDTNVANPTAGSGAVYHGETFVSVFQNQTPQTAQGTETMVADQNVSDAEVEEGAPRDEDDDHEIARDSDATEIEVAGQADRLEFFDVPRGSGFRVLPTERPSGFLTQDPVPDFGGDVDPYFGGQGALVLSGPGVAFGFGLPQEPVPHGAPLALSRPIDPTAAFDPETHPIRSTASTLPMMMHAPSESTGDLIIAGTGTLTDVPGHLPPSRPETASRAPSLLAAVRAGSDHVPSFEGSAVAPEQAGDRPNVTVPITPVPSAMSVAALTRAVWPVSPQSGPVSATAENELHEKIIVLSGLQIAPSPAEEVAAPVPEPELPPTQLAKVNHSFRPLASISAAIDHATADATTNTADRRHETLELTSANPTAGPVAGRSDQAPSALIFPPAVFTTIKSERTTVQQDAAVDIVLGATGLGELRVASSQVATPLSVPVPAVVAQVAQMAVGKAGRRTELVLQPEELGKLTLRLTTDERSVTLFVLAERPETLDLLRRNIDDLAQEFRDLGYDDVSFNFGSQGQSEPQDEPANRQILAPIDVHPGLQETAPPKPPTSRGSLDIRL